MRLFLVTAYLAGMMVWALAGCAHQKEAVRAPETKQRDGVMDAVVARWVAEWPDRKVMRYLGAAEFGLAVVEKLKSAGYVIEPASEPRPPRDSWDTDESIRWVELAVDDVQVEGENATAKLTTRWLSGSRREEFSLVKKAGEWVVVESSLVSDSKK